MIKEHYFYLLFATRIFTNFHIYNILFGHRYIEENDREER